jgi:hypothetical protein
VSKKTLEFEIRDPGQLAAIGSPARLRVIECLSLYGPASAAQIAHCIRRIPESLYYHIRQLDRLVAPRLVLTRRKRGERFRHALARSYEALLRAAARDCRRALSVDDVATDGPARRLMVHRYNVRLRRVDVVRLNRLLDEVGRLMQASDCTTGGDAMAVTVAMSPAPGARSTDGRRG